jgi:hypothetical protein
MAKIETPRIKLLGGSYDENYGIHNGANKLLLQCSENKLLQ